MMTNLEHDLIVALRKASKALLFGSDRERAKAHDAADRLLQKHDPEWTCAVCDGGPGNNCRCSCSTEPCHHEELDMDGVCKSCGLGGAPSRW